MTLHQLQLALRKKDSRVEVEQDALPLFRIFIYSLKGKREILTYIDKSKEFSLVKISNYPNDNPAYPLCVLRVMKLRKKKRCNRALKTANNQNKTQL